MRAPIAEPVLSARLRPCLTKITRMSAGPACNASGGAHQCR
jgi:hypothetical protein